MTQLLKCTLDIGSALAGEGHFATSVIDGLRWTDPTEKKMRKQKKQKEKEKKSRNKPCKAKKITLTSKKNPSSEHKSSSDSDSEVKQGKEKESENEKEDVAIQDALFNTPRTAQQEMRPGPRRAP